MGNCECEDSCRKRHGTAETQVLEGTLSTKFLSCDPSGPSESQVPIIDSILRVHSALVNFCPSVVPFDKLFTD